jgi:hypothetical protein
VQAKRKAAKITEEEEEEEGDDDEEEGPELEKESNKVRLVLMGTC